MINEFPPISTAEWLAQIQADLKGKDPSTLVWNTEERIAVKPFYRSEDLPESAGAPLKTEPGWKVRYEVAEPEPNEARSIALRALEHGAQEIVFIDTKVASFRDLLTGIDAPVHFRFGVDSSRALAMIRDSRLPALRGSIDYDPVADGGVIDVQLTADIRAKYPDFCPVVVRAASYHAAGATTVEELAFAIASGVEYLAAVGGDAAASIAFEFAVGSNYFFEIAKLRAARVLWAQVQEGFGVRMRMNVYARTSDWNQTVYDPYNNLLRGTTGAMSAAAGGADGLTVIPFDAAYRKPDELSRRLALNTQLILRDEAHFDEVADPGAGSWYIEALTDAIGREAWKLFQQIETGGGMIHALREGFVVNTLTKSREARNAAVAQRRRVLVGTNQYPNLRETMLEQIDKPLSPERGGWVFEHIRLATERHVKQTGRPIQVLLLTLGDLKMRRARADFITNFFGIAGFAISEPPAFPKPEAAADYAAEARADLIVLCSSDPEYAVIAPAIVKRLRASRVNTPVLIAGKAGDVGLESVNIKSNAVATLTDWQKRLGVQQ